VAPTIDPWHPPLPYELLPLEDSLAYKRTATAPVSGKGEKKRTQEELKLRAKC